MTDRPWLNLRPCLMHVSLLLLQRHQADDTRWKWTINSIKIPESKISFYLKGLTAKQKLLQAQLWIRRCEGEEVYSHWLKLCCLSWIWRAFCALYDARFSTSSHQWQQGREVEGPGCVRQEFMGMAAPSLKTPSAPGVCSTLQPQSSTEISLHELHTFYSFHSFLQHNVSSSKD